MENSLQWLTSSSGIIREALSKAQDARCYTIAHPLLSIEEDYKYTIAFANMVFHAVIFNFSALINYTSTIIEDDEIIICAELEIV